MKKSLKKTVLGTALGLSLLGTGFLGATSANAASSSPQWHKAHPTGNSWFGQRTAWAETQWSGVYHYTRIKLASGSDSGRAWGTNYTRTVTIHGSGQANSFWGK
ncbi:hypothetical protein ACO11K_000053 [Bacillus cytotoxicus]|uniref:hypothetical protein n=1 Tax=Bacillus cereus group TaxID=86661 RepID=UPI001F591579|nr:MULTISPECIES: hypothetical protein [Bacillus cereus group]EMA6341813.1 hypothetical protein [Bacillus cytotoxicus]MDH2887017.1 hypothetical protein [Bacillus cytotoxicus]